jgi:hypothetical protein
MRELDISDARLHWDLSRYAYRDESAARQAVESKGLTGFTFYDSENSTQAFSCTDGTRSLLAFRGSEAQPVDWIRNAQFIAEPGELGGSVHSGHRRALSEVWEVIAADQSASGLPVSVTGHSLGASLATLAAARFAGSGVPVDVVYTYGQPRTGKSDFQRAYDERLGDVTFRFVNHIDLVTRVPLLLLGYRHVGRRMYFNEAGSFNPDAGTWPVARDDLTYRLRHFGRIQAAGLDPHLMPAYSARMGSL